MTRRRYLIVSALFCYKYLLVSLLNFKAMKRFFLIPCLIVTAFLMSGQPGKSKDTVPTLERIDSIIVYSDNSYPNERIFKSIGDLRVHIDSINRKSNAYHHELALASLKRDSITHAMIQITIERDKLKDENETNKNIVNAVTKFPDYLMLFAIVIAGFWVGQGAREGYIKWKNVNSNNHA